MCAEVAEAEPDPPASSATDAAFAVDVTLTNGTSSSDINSIDFQSANNIQQVRLSKAWKMAMCAALMDATSIQDFR